MSHSGFFTASVSASDPEIAKAIELELGRQRHEIELIASENIVSKAVLEAQGSVLTNKYAEGYPGKRYYGGCQFVDIAENLAIDRAKKLFDCGFANVQPNSGSQANQSVFLALATPGDSFMGLDLAAGGHLTHGSPVNLSGKWFKPVPYTVRKDDNRIDMEQVAALAKEHKPKIIIAGGSGYSRIWDFEAFRKIADSVGAYFMVDMAHFAGLVAAGLHPSPFPHAHVVTTTTHKTLRGPRGGMVLTNDEDIAKKINSAVFPGLQGGPLMHAVAAKATCFKVAASEGFRAYQRQVRANADSLAAGLIDGGLSVLTGGTDTHLVQLDLRASEWTGKDAEDRLHEVAITVNRNTVPFDERPPTIASGVRLGTPAATMRGFDDADFTEVARIIAGSLSGDADIAGLRARSEALCAARPLYAGLPGFARYAA